VDSQLLLEQQVLCDDCTATTWLSKFGYGREQVEQQENSVFHAVQV